MCQRKLFPYWLLLFVFCWSAVGQPDPVQQARENLMLVLPLLREAKAESILLKAESQKLRETLKQQATERSTERRTWTDKLLQSEKELIRSKVEYSNALILLNQAKVSWQKALEELELTKEKLAQKASLLKLFVWLAGIEAALLLLHVIWFLYKRKYIG